MNFDLRLPIGILFSLFGIILTGYGFISRGSDIYAKSLGINVNIQWGIVLLVFGGLMLLMSLRARKS